MGNHISWDISGNNPCFCVKPFDPFSCCSIDDEKMGLTDNNLWVSQTSSRRYSLEDPLLIAVAAGDLDETKRFVLLNPEAAVKTVDSRENTALHIAAQYGRYRVFEYLAQQEPDLLYSQNDVKNSPSHKAAEAGSTEILHWLLTKVRTPLPLLFFRKMKE